MSHIRCIHQDNYDPTIEDSYFNPNFSVDGVTVPLEILDTAGQDEFQMMMDIYYKTADCFVFVYSITDRCTLTGQAGTQNYQSLDRIIMFMFFFVL